MNKSGTRNKLVCGVGINDVDYRVRILENLPSVDGKQKQKLIWECPIYKIWCSMLHRCYSQAFAERYPTYTNCYVCDEWLSLSNFKSWVESNNWEGKQLDKDLLIRGNKVYSPDTCCFISGAVNSFILEKGGCRGPWPIGVVWNKKAKIFVAQCSNPFIKGKGRNKYLGSFPTADEAHAAWLAHKLNLAKLLAAEIEDQKIAEALVERYENYKTV